MSNLPSSINLLMPPSDKEIKKTVRRSKIDLMSVVVIFVFVLCGVVILVFDMVLKSKKAKLIDEQNAVINQINNKSEVERSQRLINDKWISLKSVKNYTVTDYSEKILLLSKHLGENSVVDGFSFANDYTFTFNGQCKSLKDLILIIDGLENESLIENVGIQSISFADESDSELTNDSGWEKVLIFRVFGSFKLNEIE